MIDELVETYQKYLDVSHETRIEIMKSSNEEIMVYLFEDNTYYEPERLALVMHFYRMFMRVDGEITLDEKKILDEVFGEIPQEEYDDFMKEYENEDALLEGLIATILDFPPDTIYSVISIGLSIFADDGKLTKKEIDFLEQFLTK